MKRLLKMEKREKEKKNTYLEKENTASKGGIIKRSWCK
jgi:hypothetical protein